MCALGGMGYSIMDQEVVRESAIHPCAGALVAPKASTRGLFKYCCIVRNCHA